MNNKPFNRNNTKDNLTSIFPFLSGWLFQQIFQSQLQNPPLVNDQRRATGMMSGKREAERGSDHLHDRRGAGLWLFCKQTPWYSQTHAHPLPSSPSVIELNWPMGAMTGSCPCSLKPCSMCINAKCVSMCACGGWPLSKRVCKSIHTFRWTEGGSLTINHLGKVTLICDIKYTNISLSPWFLPHSSLPFSPSHSVSRSFRFPLLLCNYRSCPWALCFPHFLLPLFLPPTTLLFVHLMPLCPCPKAPWVGGRGQKQKAGLLAWRRGHWPDAERSKGHWVLWLPGEHLVDVWCWNASQDKGLTALLFRTVDSQYFFQTRARCRRLGSTHYIVYTLHCGCKVIVCSCSSICGGRGYVA